MPSGNSKTESGKPCLCGCWKLEIGSRKLTEIKLAKKLIEASIDIRWERRKRGKSQRALLADGEKCCKLTASANTAHTNVSDTAEPAHQGERQDSEEYEQQQEQNEQEEDEEVDMDNE